MSHEIKKLLTSKFHTLSRAVFDARSLGADVSEQHEAFRAAQLAERRQIEIEIENAVAALEERKQPARVHVHRFEAIR